MGRGQTVLEFLFLLLIVIVYLTTTIIPMTKDTKTAINDAQILGMANNETQKISNAIIEISRLGSGSKQTINVFVPQSTTINCDTNNNILRFDSNVELKPYPPQCPNGACGKIFPTPRDYNMNCLISTLKGPAKIVLKIEKNANQIMLYQGS